MDSYLVSDFAHNCVHRLLYSSFIRQGSLHTSKWERRYYITTKASDNRECKNIMEWGRSWSNEGTLEQKGVRSSLFKLSDGVKENNDRQNKSQETMNQ